MEKCGEIKVTNSFSIKQDELDFVFAQHYFLPKSATAQKVCLLYMCVWCRKNITFFFFFFSFQRFGRVILGVHLASVSSCNIFPYKRMMTVLLHTVPICWEEGDRTELFVCFL